MRQHTPRIFRLNVCLPEDATKIDLVFFTHPARDRFKAVVAKDDTGFYFKILKLRACGSFLRDWMCFDDTVARRLEKSRLKPGDRVYIGVEY